MIVHNDNNLPTIPIADLLPTQGNLKDLTEKNYNKLKGRIEHRGFSVPVYVWEDDNGVKHLLDGHQRRQVLTTEGWNDPIPYLKIPAKDLQEAMARLLEITSQYATITQEGIDEFMATYELNEAEVYEATSFDALTSYGETEEPEVEEDEAPEVDESEPPKSKLGEIYQLGRHRVGCMDSTVKENVEKLMDGNKADMVFTDPPYGNAGAAHYGRGELGHRHILGDEDFTTTELALRNHFDIPQLFFLQWRTFKEAIAYLEDTGKGLKTVAVWDKKNSALGQGMAEQWEAILISGDVKYKKFGGNVFRVSREQKARIDSPHPHQKPIELLTDLFEFFEAKTYIDPFLGSGSTLIACEQTGRICYGMEISESYTDVVRKRWAKYVYPDRWEEEWESLTPAIET